MKNQLFILTVFFTFLISACSSDEQPANSKGTSRKQQRAVEENYTEGEVLVVIDTSYWRTRLRDSIEHIFMTSVYGLPQGEPHFKLRRVDPRHFSGIFKKFNNIMFVANLNSKSVSATYMNGLLGPNNVKKARKDPGSSFFISSDVYEPGQNIMYLLGNSDKEVIDKVSANKHKILNYFDTKVALKQQQRYRLSKHNTNMTKIVSEHLGARLAIPTGYQLARKEPDFVWFRFPENEIDKNIFLAKKAYTSEQQFSDSSIALWRSELGKQWVRDGSDTNYYMMNQNYVPLLGEIVTSSPTYSKLCRGLWKLKDNSVGGPYISYVSLSKDGASIYYVEGFVAAPGKPKRKLIRNLRAVISTFEG